MLAADILQIFLFVVNRCVIDQDVNPAIFLYGFRNGTAAVDLFRKIARNEQALPVFRLNESWCLFRVGMLA